MTFKRLVFVAYLLEVGLLLIVLPWTIYWDRNYFVEELPVLQMVLRNNFLRGAVSGLGLVNVFAGLGELAAILMHRWRGPSLVR